MPMMEDRQPQESILSPYSKYIQSTTVYRHRWLPVALLSAWIYSISAILNSSLAGEVSPTELTFIRASLSSVCLFIMMVCKTNGITMPNRREVGFHLVNSVVVGSTIYCGIYAYTHMATADVTAIISSHVALAGLLCRIFLKEPFGILEIALVIVIILGTMLIARPPFLFQHFDDESSSSQGFSAPLTAFATAISGAFVSVLMRAMNKEHIDVIDIVFYPFLMTSVIVVIPATVFEEWSIPGCTLVRFKIILYASFAFLAYFLYAYACTMQAAVYVSLISLSDSAMVLVITILFLGHKPEWTSLVGIILISGSAVIIMVRKILLHRRTSDADGDPEMNNEDKRYPETRHTQHSATL